METKGFTWDTSCTWEVRAICAGQAGTIMVHAPDPDMAVTIAVRNHLAERVLGIRHVFGTPGRIAQ